MAKTTFLLQGLTAHSHLVAVKRLFEIDPVKRAILSVAFVNQNGVDLLAGPLAQHGGLVTVFAGIRNDITSRQALSLLLDLGVKLFVVDTGSRHVIFHPKLYYVRGKQEAKLIIGSANLTPGGLNNNVEAGLVMDLDFTSDDDRGIADGIEADFDRIPGEFLEHIIRIKTKKELQALEDSGRLLDESKTDPPRPITTAKEGSGTDTVSRIKLLVKPIRRFMAKPKAKAKAPPKAPKVKAGVIPPSSEFERIWESNELSERDLNIPSGTNTSRTGSMLFKQGRLPDIDQRHYFRDEIFGHLTWKNDPRPRVAHLERSQARFTLIIENVDYGEHVLRLTHNTDTKGAAYQQSNAMTQVHWGEVIDYVARRDLLGRLLTLYRDVNDPEHFVIEID